LGYIYIYVAFPTLLQKLHFVAAPCPLRYFIGKLQLLVNMLNSCEGFAWLVTSIYCIYYWKLLLYFVWNFNWELGVNVCWLSGSSGVGC